LHRERHQRLLQEFGTKNNLANGKCRGKSGKYLGKIPSENMADGDRQDIVDMD